MKVRHKQSVCTLWLCRTAISCVFKP